MTPTEDDLGLWAAFAAKGYCKPAGACTLEALVAEARRLRGELARHVDLAVGLARERDHLRGALREP